MNRIDLRRPGRALALIATLYVATACTDGSPLQPAQDLAPDGPTLPVAAVLDADITTLRLATAPYRDLDAAVRDGFVLLHDCETRPGEGAVGAVYVHMGRLLDGVIDPQLPDALVYAPDRNGRPKLIGVEFAIPYSMWTEADPPEYLGNAFQREDEFGVWALHAWVWLQNPSGLFAEAHPLVTCAA